MNNKQIDRLIRLWIYVSTALVIIGAIFKLQHYPYGQILIMAGIASWFLSIGIKSIIAINKKSAIKGD